LIEGKRTDASANIAEGLSLARRAENSSMIALGVLIAGELAAECGEWIRATRLISAGETIDPRTTLNLNLSGQAELFEPACFRPCNPRNDAFEAARVVGRTMAIDDAIREAST